MVQTFLYRPVLPRTHHTPFTRCLLEAPWDAGNHDNR